MIMLDKDTFQKEVLEASQPVLVDYFGDGCVPCAELLPSIEALEEQYGDKIAFTKLNTTKARRLAISQRVLGLPTVILYHGGEKVGECIKEEATKENIQAMIDSFLG
ncbi:MAG: thioredoxin family protein [Desulfovibrionales bacterium]|nr:thioredoxin family protein [Desulfovibrionales bacterium]